MKKKLKYFLTIFWFSYLIITSILLFTRGFLLTRNVQDINSTCSIIQEPNCSSNYPESNEQSCSKDESSFVNVSLDRAYSFCFEPQQRVILLIIDALRYDFTIHKNNKDNPLPYENRLPVIKNTIEEYPESTRHFRFIADPPTTTMQRLKALTTGSLPTFIDAGSNFATSEINEDNIIDQVIKNNYNVVFMGDDTWTSLYPKRFIRNYPFPSFDVWDLDTVDNGVKSKLFLELEKSDWNLLIGHFLGVDHCGHRYGPNHSEMSRKLKEMNDVIKQVIEVMDNDTILFVIGDHGMTATGDHGGESLDEISAAMFVHSKHPLLNIDTNRDSVKQVDLVPTLSSLLGTPIPFQNLGIIINNCLPKPELFDHIDSWRMPLFWLWGNVQQVVNYIKSYSEQSNIFNKENLEIHFKEFNSLSDEVMLVDSEKKYLTFSRKAIDFISKLRTLCEDVWIQFDPFSISNGLTFSFLSIFFLFILSDGIPLKELPPAIEGSFATVCCMGLLLTTISITVLHYSKIIENGFYTTIFVTNILSYLVFMLPIFQNWGVISINWCIKKHNINDFICRLVLIIDVCGLFSNSFIIEEASVLLFLLTTILILILVSIASFRSDNGSKRKFEAVPKSSFLKIVLISLIILGFLRASMYYWRCRVEQEWCFASVHDMGSNLFKNKSTKIQWGLSVMSLAIFVSVNKMWLKKCGNLSGYSITEMFTKLIPSVIVVCIAGFWVINQLSSKKVSSNYLALSVYSLTILSIIILTIRPICVYVVDRRKTLSTKAEDEDKVIPHIYNKLKVNLDKQSETDENIPIVCGLGTAYSAVYIILATYLILLVALVLGDKMAFSIIIMYLVAALLLVLTSILRVKQSETLEGLFNVPNYAVLGWIILSQYFFYATGHQPAFSNISWESAFVGTSGLFTSNYILGSLIILNTFGSHIIMGLILPLLVIIPFTLFLMTPSIFGKQSYFNALIERGELILFEKEKLVSPALFSLTCKYIAGHAIKVFVSMLAATIHCRHLMVWNVFAPKFIFEGVAMFVTIMSVLLGYLLFLRINTQIQNLVIKLNKML